MQRFKPAVYPAVVALGLVLLWLVALPAGASPGTLYVAGATGSDLGDCQDAGAPCATIGRAVAQATDGDTILIAGGIYTETVRIDQGGALTLRGGYAVSGTAWLARGPEPTVIDGNQAGTTVDIRATDAVLENLTISGGLGMMDPTFGDGCGGLKIQDSDVAIRGSAITGNGVAVGLGGGICAAGDVRAITLVVEDSLIGDNDGGTGGGALSLFQITAFITNTLITGNQAAENAVLQFYPFAGADSRVTCQNCTIADNETAAGAAIQISDPNVLILRNSILWNNGTNVEVTGPCSNCVTVTTSDVEGGWTGTGNIAANPRFVTGAGSAYHLAPNSPAVDAGTNEGAPDHDLAGRPRPVDGDQDGVAITDMGSYEASVQSLYLPLIQSD